MSPADARRPYLHVVVSDALRARISNREIHPGDILPSEMDLTQEFGVSRSVVRQALRTLSSEGLIQVVRGRGAVVATQPEWHRDAQRTAGLSSQMRALDARVSTQVISYAVRPVGGDGDRRGSAESERLGCEEVLVLERLRLLDGEPVAFIRTWLPGRVAEHVPREMLEDASLHIQLHDHAGIDVHGGPRQVRAVSAGGTLVERLGVPTGAPVLLLEGESVDDQGAVVEVFSTWHRSDRIALDITVMDPVSEQLAEGTGDVARPEATSPLPAADGLRRAEESLLEALRAVRGIAGRA